MDTAGEFDPTESRALYERSAGGDQVALRALLMRELAWLHTQVRRRIPNLVRREADTGDVVQEVATRILQTKTPLRFRDSDEFRGYLCTVVCNTLNSIAGRFLTMKRDSKKERRISSDSVLYAGDGPARSVTRPDDRAADKEDSEWLAAALDLMPGPEQDLIHLRVRDDLSFVEIGARLGLSDRGAQKRFKSAVMRLHRTMQSLRAGRLGSLLAG